MALEVDFITLGDASERLSTPKNRVPAPTLRHWTDQMEEFNVHFVLRNNRNERIYEESDIKVFEFLRDLKEEYGRRTTTRDLGYMIAEKGKSGELKLRTREDVPVPNPSNRTSDLLNQEDIKRVLESERARQVIGYLVSEATNNLREELIEEVRHTVREELLESKTHTQLVLEQIEERRIKREEEAEKKRQERLDRIEERMRQREERDQQARLQWEKEQEAKEKELLEKQSQPEEPKSWLQRILGK